MKIYEVWDDDPMENRNSGYIDSRYLDYGDAQFRVDALNAAHRASFVKHATDGAKRVDKEPWNWGSARLVEGKVIE